MSFVATRASNTDKLYVSAPLLFVRNYTNFKAIREHINDLDHFVLSMASGFMEHIYAGG